MKLIIDIDEQYYKDLKKITPYVCSEAITAIRCGTPLEEELDKIRKEIKKKAFLRNHDYHCHPTYSVDWEDINFIILNHIKELEEDKE